MQNILVLIYIVIFVIILIISIFYKINENIYQGYINKKSLIYTEKAKKEINSLKNGIASPEHITYLSKQLKKDKNLQSFDLMISNLNKIDKKETNTYIYSITQVFNNIIRKFYHKSVLHQAYFAYLLAKYPINEEIEQKKIRKFLLYLCDSKSIYCRENALLGLIRLGDINTLTEALKNLSINGKITQDKLLTESLINFSGDTNILINELWNNFDAFSNLIKISIINYIRITSDNCCTKMHDLLKKETDEEIIYACLRYFGKYYYPEALDLILKIGNKAFDEANWGMVAVISSVLKIYKTPSTIDFLVRAISSPSWSARENASKTIIFVFKDKASRIINRYKDKFANDMVRYQIDSKNLKDFD